MNNNDKLKQAFVNALAIEEALVVDSLQYQAIPQWDSLAHMNLISEIEDAFDVTFETEQILSLNSFAKAREILQQEHNIEF